jgi:hypothetical protein
MVAPYQAGLLLRGKLTHDYALLLALFVYGMFKGIEYAFGVSLGIIGFAGFGALSCYVVLRALISSDTVTKAKGILFASFIGNDYYFFLVGAIICAYVFISNPKVRNTRINLLLGILVAYMIGISLVGLLDEFLILNSVFGLLYYSAFLLLPLIFSAHRPTNSEFREIIKYLEALIILQIIIILFQAVLNFTFRPGDWGRGSLDGTDRTGFYVMMYFMVQAAVGPLISRQGVIETVIKRPFIFIFLPLILILLDAKMVYLGILAGFGILMLFMGANIFRFIRSLNLSTWIFIWGFAILFVLAFPSLARFYSQRIMVEQLDIGDNVRKYVEDPEFNQKFVLYNRTFGQMWSEAPVRYVLGVGAGKFGGKVSNAFSNDVLYKDPANNLSACLPSYSSYWVRRYYPGLYTEDIYKTIKWRSANLSFPFAGIITLKVEYGVVGLVLFLALLWGMGIKVLYHSRDVTDLFERKWMVAFSVMAFTIPLLMLYDNYQEFPQIMVPTMLFLSLALNIRKAE